MGTRYGAGIAALVISAVVSMSEQGLAQTQPVAPAGADSLTVNEPKISVGQGFQNWLAQPTMTGDWGGLRTRLEHDGINIRASYVGNYAYNFSGGKRIGGDYADQFAFGADVDMDKLAGLTGGIFHVTLNIRQGRNATADYVGNRINVQEIYGDGENFRLAELDYEQNLFNGALNIKAGWVIMGDDFGKTPILCDFENDAFCAHPQSLPSNSGWADYPAGHWGARVRINLPDNVYAETGIFDVNPSDALHENGFKLSLQGSTGAIIPVEFGKTVALGPSGLPGHYKIGAYYDSSTAVDPSNSRMTFKGRYGGYILADQMVWRFEPGTDRGLIVVLDGTLSEKRTSPIPAYVVAALVVQGPFAARPHDFISLGYVRDWVNSRAIDQQSAMLIASGIANPDLALGENIVELGYGVQATPWMQIHPNVQFIGNPGAFSYKHLANAWVFGSELKVTF
jgi:porin